MEAILIGGLGIGLGFLVLLLLSSAGVRRANEGGQAPARWVSTLSAEALARLLELLLGELKLDVGERQVAPASVELWVSNPAPVSGGRIYVRALLADSVGEEEVWLALETARAEGAGKVLLVTTGSYSAEAFAASVGSPVELVDGEALARLVQKHLPTVAVTGKV